MTVTILLVDDHPMIRQGLRNLLGDVSDFQVVGEASDGLEALREIELKKPDVLVIDIMMPNLNGLGVLVQIQKLSPRTHAIVFSMQSAEVYVLEAMRAGAAGYILKDTGPGEIVQAIYAVMSGNRYVSEQLSEWLEENSLSVDEIPVDLQQTLTMREREIIQMVAEGQSSNQIGNKIGISPRTVEIHRSNLMKKLNLKNQAELILYAIKHGIISLDT
jgi:two-component system, NarL family, response regulator NreC